MAALFHVYYGAQYVAFQGPESPDLLYQSLSFHIVDWQEPQRFGEQNVAGPSLTKQRPWVTSCSFLTIIGRTVP